MNPEDTTPLAPHGAASPSSSAPLAVVQGEPLHEPPSDLYIPPQALRVLLQQFEGPLDLLLYLIRRQNLDILQIPIATITEQYLGYIELIRECRLELAGDYLVMAATLAEIKSRMLLPRPAGEDAAEEEDPRAELARRLLQYERFRKAADHIAQLHRMERDIFSAVAIFPDKKVEQPPPTVSLEQLLHAFAGVLARSRLLDHHSIKRESLSVRERMGELLQRVRQHHYTEFHLLFAPHEGRHGLVVTFLALLELLRESLIIIQQNGEFAPIHVKAA